MASIRASLRRDPGFCPDISGLELMLGERGLSAAVYPHQVDYLLNDIAPLLEQGDYLLLDGCGDLEGVLFFERPSPFLSSELQRKLQALPPRPQWSAAFTSNSSSSFFEDAIDGLVDAGKQVLNDFIAGQRASQAEWFAEQGIIQATDKATGQALSSEELAERNREIETVSISPAQQGGADAIQSLRGYEAGLLVAEAAVNRKKIITDAKEIKDAIVDSISPGVAKTKAKGDTPELPGKSLLKMKRFKLPCFEPGPKIKQSYKGRERELESHFARQLKHQEAGLNDLTVGEYIENRNRYKDMKRTGTGLAQEDFRERLSKKLEDSLRESYRKKLTSKEARTAAKLRASEIMADLAALHDPDMIAGGADKVSRMGAKDVNSSIGAQWQSKSRLAQMDEQAQRALETMGADAKMNVALERCPLRGQK